MAYNNILFFDLETTGLDYENDRIIEFGAVLVDAKTNKVLKTHSVFVNAGKFIPPVVENLTGISNDDIKQEGITESALVELIKPYFNDDTLLVAYNIHFDINFMYYLLKRFDINLEQPNVLDMLTVYRERHSYPHKLSHAIEQYNIDVKPTHRSLDDTEAMVKLYHLMKPEFANIDHFINKVCFVQKYGLKGKQFSNIRYVPFNFKLNTVANELNTTM